MAPLKWHRHFLSCSSQLKMPQIRKSSKVYKLLTGGGGGLHVLGVNVKNKLGLSWAKLILTNLELNPNQVGGGQICPPVGKTLYTSGTKSPIDLKPGCKFKFVVCLETYLKKLVRSDHWGSLADLFGRCIWFLNSEFSTILDFRQKNRFFKKFWGLQF